MFNPNGQTLASGSIDGTVKVWRVNDGKLLHSLNHEITSTLTSPVNGKVLKIWNTKTSFSGVSFSPDGKILAGAGNTAVIKLWDAINGTEIRILTGHQYECLSVAFSPDGKILACGSRDGTIKLWEVESGKELRTLTGHSDDVKSVAFNNDGKILASGSLDGTVKLWELATGKELADLTAFDDEWLVATPDGRFDTNKSLDQIQDLHWNLPNEPLKAFPLEIFMRQYYEPGLLQRVLNGEQFKPLPSIADINRVQPKVVIKEIKPAASAADFDLVDVTIEVESVMDNVSVSATERTKTKQLISGAYDLRLFRDGQLVGVSAPPSKSIKFSRRIRIR